MAHDVFLSHSAQNREVADAVCAALEKAGIRCWVAPRDVRPGRTFPGEITRAIQQSKVMLLIFSSHSNNSEQVLREVQLATDSRLPIIRFRIEDVALTDDLRYFLSSPHWLDALTPPLSTHIARLEVAIKGLLIQSVEVTGKNVVGDEEPSASSPSRSVASPATPAMPSVIAPINPPPLPVASPQARERGAAPAKAFNPWPLVAIAAVVICAAVIGGVFLLVRQMKPAKQQSSTNPSQSAQTADTLPLTTKVTQNTPAQSRQPKPSPAAVDTEPPSESDNVSAFERAGALKRSSEPRNPRTRDSAYPPDRPTGPGGGNSDTQPPEEEPED
jgi:hypothetical protein